MIKILENGLQEAISLIQKNDLIKSETLLTKLNFQFPDNPDIQRFLGIVFALKKDWKKSLDSLNKCISVAPEYGIAYSNRGNIYSELGRYQDAIADYEKAIALEPNYAEAYNNMGNAFHGLSKFSESLFWYEKAIALEPNYAEAYNNMGNALLSLRKPQEAIDFYERAVGINPNYFDAIWHKSTALLSLGDFNNGWRGFEYRWLQKNSPPNPYKHIPPLEDFSRINNKSILIWCEQGFGDSIQFSRFIPALADLGANITFICPPQLRILFQSLRGVVNILSFNDVLPCEFSYQSPLLSLPLLFTLNGCPSISNKPYLNSISKKDFFWKNELKEFQGLKVGLVWNGGYRSSQSELWAINERRNIPLLLTAKLQVLRNITFVSLQKGDPAESELETKRGEIWPTDNLLIFTDQLKDFSDSAALINNLDLVISVDTAIAHLAGALGKPVWLLNRYDSCWRWLVNQKLSPWYPSMRIYNQKTPGDWVDVIEDVKNDLHLLQHEFHRSIFT